MDRSKCTPTLPQMRYCQTKTLASGKYQPLHPHLHLRPVTNLFYLHLQRSSLDPVSKLPFNLHKHCKLRFRLPAKARQSGFKQRCKGVSCRHVPTLVLDLDDVLVHSEWTRGRGWRTFKRPGVEDFLKRMAPYYEMVVYTSQVCPDLHSSQHTAP